MDEIGCAEAIERLRLDRAMDPVGDTAHHVHGGGWQTYRVRIGEGWLGKATLRRLERSGARVGIAGICWGNILPPGAESARHRHGAGKELVAVWCLTNSGGVLHVGYDAIPDQAGQLIIFQQNEWHWVPKVNEERVTIAANL